MITHLILAASAVALTVGGGAAARPEIDGPTPPVLSYQQTPDTVTVTLHNPNRIYGLRNQRVDIILRGVQGNILRSYGPDEVHTSVGRPGARLRCCLIDVLPPGGDFVFRLFPMVELTPPYAVVKVAGVQIRPDHGPHWEVWPD